VRKSTLYAGRILGDIAPGLEPTRLGGDDAKAWARMDFPGRILPGQSDQLITAKSATQKFEIGTRRIEYGRTFHYAKAGADLTNTGMQRLVANGNYTAEATGHDDEFGFYGDLLTAGAIGDKYVDLEEAGAARVANFFQGGYFTTWPAGGPRPMHYIVKSDASTATYTRIYLDHPLIVVIGAAIGVQAYCSPYNNIVQGLVIQHYKTFVGMGHCGDVDEDEYFWLQTEGPVWVTPTGWAATCPGYAADRRDVYADIGGTCRIDPGDGTLQRVGYLISATETTIGDVFVMLQLE